MLKCNINRGGEVYVEAEGGMTDILSEICCLIDDIYDTIKKRDRVMAEVFRDALTETLCSEESGMWRERKCGEGAVQACVVTPKKGGAEPPRE